MEGMWCFQFLDLFTELPGPSQAARVLGLFKWAFNYISFLALWSHFWTLRMPYYFYKVLFFVFFMCILPLFLQVHFAYALRV